MSSQMKAPPKKRFGQHFLRDSGTQDRLVRLIRPMPDDLILEIGAGDGALTAKLAEYAPKLLALELDRDRIPQLTEKLSPYPTARVIAGDILKIDLGDTVATFMPATRLRIVGNLPYNIATAIIEKLLNSALPIHDMTFMVQLEVAQRIVAHPSTRLYGYLSAFCQHYSDVQFAFKVSPSCFVPPPKVTSAVISFHPKPSSGNDLFESSFLLLTKAAFGHRRKTLANSLRHHPALEKISERLLILAGIDGRRRAETLSPAEYESLTRFYVIALNQQ
jgi:16S rRNA (adenine1518-N6/adenine1519-N6)-dimethyltransferase